MPYIEGWRPSKTKLGLANFFEMLRKEIAASKEAFDGLKEPVTVPWLRAVYGKVAGPLE